MGSIHQLSKDLIDQIAAGEVIERPASVVKELIENAIDAQATSITITIEEAGIGLIRIVDNGSGMDSADLNLAVQRHATSKLKRAEDLFSIHSLGFRGEALPSIASVSRMMIASRPMDTAHGYYLSIEGGEMRDAGKHAMPEGTILEIKDLFFNTPARKKFLKTTATEQKNIIEIITRYALAYPDISFQATIDGRSVLQLKSGQDLSQRAGILIGADFKAKMHTFTRTDTGICVHGLAAPPEINRPVRSGILCYVNNRAVRDATLSSAVNESYRGLLMRGRYPVAVLFVDIDPAEVDVNVHPAKAEVRFQNPSRVFGIIVAAIREALQAPRVLRPISPAAPLPSRPYLKAEYASFPPDKNTVQSAEQAYLPKPAGFYTNMSIIGTLKNAYVLLEDDAALIILDQHAAHERMLYEQLTATPSLSQVQMLLHPLIVDLSPAEYAAFEDIAPILQTIGIDCEPFGGASIAVRSIPAVLTGADIRDLILTVLHAVNAKAKSDFRAEILATMACHKSLRSGKHLSQAEILALLKGLDHVGAPRTCPHGRPIYKEISMEEIARWIGRRP